MTLMGLDQLLKCLGFSLYPLHGGLSQCTGVGQIGLGLGRVL